MNEANDKNELLIRDCGVMKYDKALELQKQLVDRRIKGQIENTVIMLEHLPVITLGARESENCLLEDEKKIIEQGIDVVSVRRGGGTTAHNPGQVIIYPILDIRSIGLGVNEYIRKLESIGIELLNQLGIESDRKKGFPGLWIGERKIGSIGVKIKKGVSFHGMAINICNDLSIFKSIVPCGLKEVIITNVLKETDKNISTSQVKEKLAELCKKYFSTGVCK
ncbi:MAG: lipoyl(octanoyl) transferase LipB [Sedimentisphaerales bacterium]|nr:lipoyl(octanoyl) transferase LipB [Sedimentisphaerales bacterium]